MAAFQISGIPENTWRAFRLMCLEENVSANRKLRELIEAQVSAGAKNNGQLNRQEHANEE